MRYGCCVLAAVVMLGGCARKSSLLLERQARGPILEESSVARTVNWRLDPPLQSKADSAIEVEVQHASATYLHTFFSNRKVFGTYAGANPYFPEHLVFYVKIANRTDKKIRINPAEFVLLDDRGNQYNTISTDYVTAYADYRQAMASTTRGLLESASPGYFGVSVPVGKFIAAKPQGRFALLQQSALQSGYLYPGIVHDGLIAFWTPSTEAKQLHLLVTNIKTAFDANDFPQKTVEIPFDFTASHP